MNSRALLFIFEWNLGTASVDINKNRRCWIELRKKLLPQIEATLVPTCELLPSMIDKYSDIRLLEASGYTCSSLYLVRVALTIIGQTPQKQRNTIANICSRVSLLREKLNDVNNTNFMRNYVNRVPSMVSKELKLPSNESLKDFTARCGRLHDEISALRSRLLRTKRN